jgi:hypothetical protein
VLEGCGLRSGSVVLLEMRSDPVAIGSIVVGPTGSFRAIIELPDRVEVGVHAMYARGAAEPGSVLPAAVERVVTVAVDENGIVVGTMQDLRDVPEAGVAPEFPLGLVTGRGQTTIVTQQDGSLLYIDERVSTSATAASIRSAAAAISAPGTYSGGIVTVLIVALLGILLEIPFAFVQERAKRAYSSIAARFSRQRQSAEAPRLLGIRVEVFLFLALGQVIVQLNAPIELLPPPTQVLRSALFGAVAIVAIGAWYAMPLVAIHYRRDRDLGEFRGEWPSLVVAALALIAAHVSGVVPGFIIGLFTVRKFRSALPESLTARGALIATLSIVALALLAWVVLDAVESAVPDATSWLRIVVDGILGVVLVAGSQGALLSLLDPGDSGAMALRRTSLGGWLVAIVAAGGLSFALLVTEEIDLALFAPPASAGEYLALLAFALLSLSAIVLAQRLVTRQKGRLPAAS